MEQEENIPGASGETAPFCSICQTAIQPGEECGQCPSCGAIYHTDCWQENGGCAVYGCEHVPPTDSRSSVEIPVSYWGQEQKPCPVCGRQIQAAAVRCRHCGSTFETARPVGEAEHREALVAKLRQPGLRRGVIILFVLSALPFTAPFAAIGGTPWWLANRERLRRLPSLYAALAMIGLCIAIAQTLLMVVMGILYSATRVR